MKDDVEVPDEIPSKRRALHDALDVWIATWLAHPNLTPADRRRLQAEKDRRRAMRRVEALTVGLIAAEAGMTPHQFVAVLKALQGSGATSVLHTRLPRRAHGTIVGACNAMGASHTLVADIRDEQAAARAIVHEADVVIAAPRETTAQTYATPGVWSIIGLAHHRRLAVLVVFPNGEIN